jgi:hypothetical protein
MPRTDAATTRYNDWLSEIWREDDKFENFSMVYQGRRRRPMAEYDGFINS